MKSVMKHTFSQVPRADIPRSSFDRSHGHKTTFDAGLLIPIYADEALPGDTFNVRMAAFGRLATPLHPFMDNLFLETQFFAVPIRLIWDNWERFNGAQDDPGDSTDFLVPTITHAAGFSEQSIADYLGIPPKVPNTTVDAFWHRAYNLIWNEWYRDQNLQDSVVVHKGDGPDPVGDYQLLRRGKRHDYFTSCLPWPQKGPSVELPLGSTAPVIGTGSNVNVFTAADPTMRILNANTTNNVVVSGGAPASVSAVRISQSSTTNASGMVADLSDATAATINQLRQAFQIQKLYERDARGGTRYIELLKAHFGVTSPDARLQRPEYLGGGSSAINLSSVPQTSATGAYATTPQGNLSAYGTVGVHGHGFTKSFVEHCVIIGLASVRADLTYQQGLNRMFSRQTRWDFYWPALSHIGEQAVLNKEIFLQDGSLPINNDTFGYQERFAEYRYKPSIITGRFRSDATLSLDTWHLSQDFASLPALNASFIEEHPPVKRVLAVPDEPDIILDAFFSMRCARPMPVYSVPGLIDHF